MPDYSYVPDSATVGEARVGRVLAGGDGRGSVHRCDQFIGGLGCVGVLTTLYLIVMPLSCILVK